MSQIRFRFVCSPSALEASAADWARSLIEEGEVALMCSEGLGPIERVTHDLGQAGIVVVRSERTQETQERTVMDYAGAMPLVWVSSEFTEAARIWARDRGPMTLLCESSGPLSDEDQRRIDRFIAILGRQSE